VRAIWRPEKGEVLTFRRDPGLLRSQFSVWTEGHEWLGAALRSHVLRREVAPAVPYAKAVSRKPALSWTEGSIAVPEFVGARTLSGVPLAEIAGYIDWSPFFHAWEMKGTYPSLLDDARFGAAARDLFNTGRALLDEIVEQGLLEARGVYGFFAAHSEGDDIVLFGDATRDAEVGRFHTLRQQRGSSPDGDLLALADFIAPSEAGVCDYIGAFAVSAGFGLDGIVRRFEDDHDDYRAILAKALADRLAEAFAEMLHARVRREWGYGRDESATIAELIRERYRGIRPAPGYPACPDHSEKATLWRLLDVERRVGIRLTESFAMHPAASVSGFYFAHPQARYFAVGKIGRDQVASYAGRKGVATAEIERWLAQNLDYEPPVS
jgi:5-methyltetrahydrofolate--homocysteine methyltransferase